MKRVLINFSLLTLISTSLFAKADRELVKEYMDISGATQTIESLSSQIVSGVEQTSAIYGQKADPKEIEELEKIFAPHESVLSVEKSLINNFDNQNLTKILAFYHSKIGMKLTEANLDAIKNSTQSDMLRYIASLRENPPSKLRAKIINEYIDALGSDKILEDLFFEMFDFLNEKTPKDKRFPQNKRYQFIQMLQSSFEQQLFLSTMYIYKDISDEDIQKATSYLKSKEGSIEKKTVRKAINAMIKDGLKRAR